MARVRVTKYLSQDPLVFRFAGERSEDNKHWARRPGRVWHIAKRVGEWHVLNRVFEVRSMSSACERVYCAEGDPANPYSVKQLSEVRANEVCRRCAACLSWVYDEEEGGG